jgi:nucleoid DNA-binding protein
MNEKLSFQSIADALAKKAGVQKKVADTFSKAFFDTIVEALVAGETLKIKGLGTFKLVEVDDRESVNVSTGKRFVIPGYKKVAFTAEDKVLEVLNERTESEVVKEKKEESVSEEKPVVKEEKPVEIEELIQVPEPEKVETPQNAFAGIDMLISTPESVEEIRQQYEEAKVKMETAVEEARKANAEKIRLEKLLERLEKNVEPEVAGHTDITDNTEKVEEEISVISEISAEDKKEESVSEEAKRQEAFQRVMTEQPTYQEPEPQQKKMSKKRLWLTILIILLVTILGIFIYLIHQNIEAVEKVHPVEKVEKPTQPVKPAKPTKPAAPKVDKDSLAKAQKADSVKVEPKKEEVKKPEEAQQPERPKTHRMQRGESLTRISQKYYGTKDSVRAILRINTFANPDNIPVGAVVKLP